MRCKHPSEDDVEMLVSGDSAYIYPCSICRAFRSTLHMVIVNSVPMK